MKHQSYFAELGDSGNLEPHQVISMPCLLHPCTTPADFNQLLSSGDISAAAGVKLVWCRVGAKTWHGNILMSLQFISKQEC